MDAAFHLSRGRSLLKLELPRVHHGSERAGGQLWAAGLGQPGPALPLGTLPSLPDLGQTLSTNVLAGVLDAGDQVGDEFVDGPFVLHGPRHPLGHLDLVRFTAVRQEARSAQEAAGAGGQQGAGACPT